MVWTTFPPHDWRLISYSLFSSLESLTDHSLSLAYLRTGLNMLITCSFLKSRKFIDLMLLFRVGSRTFSDTLSFFRLCMSNAPESEESLDWPSICNRNEMSRPFRNHRMGSIFTIRSDRFRFFEVSVHSSSFIGSSSAFYIYDGRKEGRKDRREEL